jgi:hypothetical protein
MTQRFSLVYDPHEDRVAWDTVDANGATVRLWLTERFCRGLVGALLPLLQTAASPAEPAWREDALQSWEQAVAMADFGKTPAVRTCPQTVVGLVRAAHIRPFADHMELAFEFGAAQPWTLGVSRAAVRQMLAVMHGLYVAAGWPLGVWPAWIADPAAPPADALN